MRWPSIQALSMLAYGRTGLRDSVDLELWDLQHEVELFREVFGKTLQVAPKVAPRLKFRPAAPSRPR
mgnify:CR=1 FL=1